jgi:hypothetical protein
MQGRGPPSLLPVKNKTSSTLPFTQTSKIAMSTTMSTSNSQPAKTPGGIKKSLASIFKSPAAENYNKVLAETADQAEGDNSSLYSDPKLAPLSTEEKIRRLVEQRDANSPTGHFVLGEYKPLAACQGYAGYYAAKGATGK